MSYLTEEQLTAIRKNLEKQRNTIVKKAETLRSEASETDASGDDADIASAEGIVATMERLRSRELRLLKKVEEQLKWMDDLDEFGYCEECGVEIGYERLLARPAARKCIVCKENEEREERGYYHPRRRKARRPTRD